MRRRSGCVEGRSKILKFIIGCTICIMGLWVTASADSGWITGNGVNFRVGPSTETGVICVLARGTVVMTNGASNGWVNVTYNGNTGYVYSQYISVRADGVSRSGGTVNRNISTGEALVAYAKQFIGTPYVYGGSAPGGFDCSGFTSYVYHHYGYSINRTAAGQTANGVAVSRDNLIPGDLVMFNTGGGGISHVAIYAGGGQIIHAKKPGSPLGLDQLNSGYYDSRYVCARRILN